MISKQARVLLINFNRELMLFSKVLLIVCNTAQISDSGVTSYKPKCSFSVVIACRAVLLWSVQILCTTLFNLVDRFKLTLLLYY